MPRLFLIAGLVFLLGVFVSAQAATEEQVAWIVTQARSGDFALVEGERAAELVIAPGDFKVVEIAANDFAADVERVTGKRPVVRKETRGLNGPVVLIGTLGKNLTIDALVAAGKLDVSALRDFLLYNESV